MLVIQILVTTEEVAQMGPITPLLVLVRVGIGVILAKMNPVVPPILVGGQEPVLILNMVDTHAPVFHITQEKLVKPPHLVCQNHA